MQKLVPSTPSHRGNEDYGVLRAAGGDMGIEHRLLRAANTNEAPERPTEMPRVSPNFSSLTPV